MPGPMDDRFQRAAAKLALVLVNGIEVAPGDQFPIGWHSITGDREYETATEELLEEARRLCSNMDQ
jgi:hypothetical protein